MEQKVHDRKKAETKRNEAPKGNDYTGKLWYKALRLLFAPVRVTLRHWRWYCADPTGYLTRVSFVLAWTLVYVFFTVAVGLLFTGHYCAAAVFGVFSLLAAHWVANWDGE